MSTGSTDAALANTVPLRIPEEGVAIAAPASVADTPPSSSEEPPASLSLSCSLLLGTLFLAQPPADTRPMAATAAEEAIRLDDRLTEAHEILAVMDTRDWLIHAA